MRVSLLPSGRILSLALILAGLGCASRPGKGADAGRAEGEVGGQASIGAGDRIEMSRGTCFGTCPVYWVVVRGDGSVRFVGERFVQATGTHEASIPVSAVAALFARADSIGFFDMPSDITPGNASVCGPAPTDMPGAVITIEWGARSHTVRHYHGCRKAPESLGGFEDHIDATLGTARWIGAR